MLVEEKQKMKLILPAKEWKDVNPLEFEELEPSSREDISFIMIDNCENEPAVLEVFTNIFKNKKTISFAEESLKQLKELLATIEVKSNEELVEAIKQSRIDKKKGDFRKLEDIVRERGLE